VGTIVKLLAADTFYPEFLKVALGRAPESRTPYAAMLDAVLSKGFGHLDAFSASLRALGHDVVDVVLNSGQLQRAWAKERGLVRLGMGPVSDANLYRIFEQQVRAEKPDVLYIHDIAFLPSGFVKHLRELVPRVVAQTAQPLIAQDYSAYDLVVTSLPHFVERFRQAGVPAEYLALAFDLRAAGRERRMRDVDVSFVGGLTSVHREGRDLLEEVARQVPVDVWGHGENSLAPSSPLRRRFHGAAWGWEMYDVLGRTRVALNRHATVAGVNANNMRLFEATGMAACLLTEEKANLSRLFNVGTEIVTYSDAADAADKIRYLLDHPTEREQIAGAGQRRTRSEHTYEHRTKELLTILEDVPAHASPGRDRSSWKPPRRVLTPDVRHRLGTSPIGPSLRRLRDRLDRGRTSSSHVVIDSAEGVESRLASGWRDANIPVRQRVLVDRQLAEMRSGSTPRVFQVAAEAIQATGLTIPAVLEVGCASGYYVEVLGHLLSQDLNYIGIDYSSALILQARQHYPNVPFGVADAKHLPVADRSFDIVLSGCVLLHVADYERAILESFRAAGRFVIFHRTPISAAPTTWMRKKAYGIEVVELLFNEDELLAQIRKAGGKVVRRWTVDWQQLPGNETRAEVVTYLCRAHD
jgi:SAM-dependent methyltransferase